MELIKVTEVNDALAEMAAMFRVELRSYKGITLKPDIKAGREEIEEYLAAKFPVFAVVMDGTYIGYAVCRVDEPCVWMESIFVKQEYRRMRAASALLAEAEKIAAGYGEDTVYYYVHPNNYGMIEFLSRHGYTVLNLIEIRKPHRGEQLRQTFQVGKSEFDY